MRLNKEKLKLVRGFIEGMLDMVKVLEVFTVDEKREPAGVQVIESEMRTDRNGQVQTLATLDGILVDVQVLLPDDTEKTEFVSWAVDVKLNDKRVQSQVLAGSSGRTTLVLNEPVVPNDDLRVQVSVNGEPCKGAVVSATFQGAV